ncbi:CpsD/CapB family tyrosine-protein kinase [uncultured Clostridium sp.]|jgi:capsular exopolysaccharide synthesis family protein|uniref:CpsD/CapB family tyrosine-protein kinase n=1 Tax=uncultured Clostridium sp. TaxID=59620 RepID=UPI002632CB6E|nr:CpsD/CapB family tyrosine-protein kinase [uncultured Clostridium sp.]
MFIVEKEPKSLITEEYKTLRTNIQYSSYEKKLEVILVTSSNPKEGKSTTAGNLLISLAQDNKKVIIIDCDLRRPTIHKKFKLSNNSGLSEVIVGRSKFHECVQEYSENIDILTAGKIPPNPSELLGSRTMRKLIEKLKEFYDYIIIDTPPLLSVTDAQILSSMVDGVVFVVRANKTKKDDILQAKKNLERVSANVIGTILHGVSKKENKNKYYYGEVEKTRKKRSKH